MVTANGANVGEQKATTEQSNQWKESYRRHLSRYGDFTDKLRDLLGNLLKNANIDVIQIDGRAKTVESFAEKIRRKGAQYDDPLRQMTDLVGLRVITYYMEDVSRVGDLINDEFAVDPASSVDNAEIAQPERFGYRSVHHVATLGPNRRDLREWAPFRDVRFEVQVRTSLQHAWAAVDHKLRYKTAKDVPNDLKRRLYRLGALFELADEQFSELRVASERIRESYSSQMQEGDFAAPLDAESLAAYLAASEHFDVLVERARRAGWRLVRQTDPKYRSHLVAARRDLLEALHAIRIETIEELDGLLRKVLEEDPGFVERFVKQVRIMPDQILALALGHLRREERRPRPELDGRRGGMRRESRVSTAAR